MKFELMKEVTNSAVLGAAYQAKHALHRNELTFEQITNSIPEPTLLCTPYNDADSVNTFSFINIIILMFIIVFFF